MSLIKDLKEMFVFFLIFSWILLFMYNKMHQDQITVNIFQTLGDY